jgi:hypothetical protein
MNKNKSPEIAKIRTVKYETQKTRSWLKNQRSFIPASFPEIQSLSHFIVGLVLHSDPQDSDSHDNDSLPPQRLDDTQSNEEENQQIENAHQWIHRFLTEQEENPELLTFPEAPQEPNHDSSQDDHLELLTDILEHDNRTEENRSPPRSSLRETDPQSTQPSILGPFTTLLHTVVNIHEPPQQTTDLTLSDALVEKSNQLLSIFHETNPEEIETKLEDFLSELSANPIQEADRTPLSLDTPIIPALVQSKSYRICRKQIFCPFEDCHAEVATIQMLSNHLHTKHDVSRRKCTDIVQFFISQMFERGLKTTLVTINEKEEEEEELVHSDEAVERCYLPQCKTMHSNHKYLSHSQHMKNPEHIRLKINTDLLGWFWGIIKLNTTDNPLITIQDLLKECEAFQCQSNKCHKHILSTEQGIRSHFSSQHRIKDRVEWRASYKKIIIKTIMTEAENDNAQTAIDHQNQETNPETNPSDPVQLFLNTRRRPCKKGILRPIDTQTSDLETENTQEANDRLTTLRRIYIQKRSNLLTLVHSGVNLPPLTMKDKRKLRFPLKDLFKYEINPLLEEIIPKTDDWDSWLAFEGLYEDALDKVRKLIIHTTGRDVRRLYGIRKINVALQAAREKATDEVVTQQTSQRQLRKIKMFLHEIAESAPDDEQNHHSAKPNSSDKITTLQKESR